jgi:hypothetical protein
MANFLGNFVSSMGVPAFYFQNLVTLLMIPRLVSNELENMWKGAAVA